MAVDAGAKRSIFTRQLAERLGQQGIEVPALILDLLDKPFAAFSGEDARAYEQQVKGQDLLVVFAKALREAYESSSESAKHSWKGLCHLLKDSPIKVCVSFVLKQEERPLPRRESAAVPRGESAPAPGTAREVEEPPPPRGDAARKSFFTKKLERKLDERGIKVPASIIALLDKPFDELTAEERALYEEQFKGRQLTILFSDLLDELYEETGRVASGWNAMCRYLKDTPMKLIATYVVQEEERLEVASREAVPDTPPGRPMQEKLNVKPYQPAEDPRKSQHARWRKK